MLTHTRTEDSATGRLTYGFVGRLDGESSEEFYEVVTDYKPSNFSSFLLDMEGVDYISSAGLRAILKLLRWCRESGVAFALSNASSSVAYVFEIAAVIPKDQMFASNELAERYLSQ